MTTEEAKKDKINGLTKKALEEFDQFRGKPDLTLKSFMEQVDLQLQAMEALSLSLADDLVKGANFGDLQEAALDLPNNYTAFLISHYNIEKLLSDIHDLGGEYTFRKLELLTHGYRALKFDLSIKWWWETFTRVFLFVTGKLAMMRLISEPTRKPQFLQNMAIFNYGDFKPFNTHWTEFGLKGKRTLDSEDAVPRIFSTRKHPFGLTDLLSSEFLSSYQRFDLDDKTADYMAQIFEGISDLRPIEAYQMFFDGTLRNYIAKRATDRIKNPLVKKDAQKRGGRSLEEMGEIIRNLRVARNIPQSEIASVLKCTKEDIAHIEEGRITQLDRSILSEIARYFGVDIKKITMAYDTIFDTDLRKKKDGNSATHVESLQISVNDSIESPMSDLEGEVIAKDLKNQLMDLYPKNSLQRKILTHIEDGYTQEEFAKKLKVSLSWIEKNMKEIRENPRIKDLTDL